MCMHTYIIDNKRQSAPHHLGIQLLHEITNLDMTIKRAIRIQTCGIHAKYKQVQCQVIVMAKHALLYTVG